MEVGRETEERRMEGKVGLCKKEETIKQNKFKK
jgi:hypothetical protein